MYGHGLAEGHVSEVVAGIVAAAIAKLQPQGKRVGIRQNKIERAIANVDVQVFRVCSIGVSDRLVVRVVRAELLPPDFCLAADRKALGRVRASRIASWLLLEDTDGDARLQSL